MKLKEPHRQIVINCSKEFAKTPQYLDKFIKLLIVKQNIFTESFYQVTD